MADLGVGYCYAKEAKKECEELHQEKRSVDKVNKDMDSNF